MAINLGKDGVEMNESNQYTSEGFFEIKDSLILMKSRTSIYIYFIFF